MTITLSFRGRQGRAGSPLVLDAYQLSDDSAVGPNVFIGTTNTATPPATFGGFAYVVARDLWDAWWDRALDLSRSQQVGGVPGQYSDRQTARKSLALDANFAVGKYVWIANFASSSPSGSDAPTTVAGPYLIR